MWQGKRVPRARIPRPARLLTNLYPDPNVGTGLVGAPACGDVMRLQIKVGDGGVIDAHWRGATSS